MAPRLLVALHEVADQDEAAHGLILRHRLDVAACASLQIIRGVGVRFNALGATVLGKLQIGKWGTTNQIIADHHGNGYCKTACDLILRTPA